MGRGEGARGQVFVAEAIEPGGVRQLIAPSIRQRLIGNPAARRIGRTVIESPVVDEAAIRDEVDPGELQLGTDGNRFAVREVDAIRLPALAMHQPAGSIRAGEIFRHRAHPGDDGDTLGTLRRIVEKLVQNAFEIFLILGAEPRRWACAVPASSRLAMTATAETRRAFTISLLTRCRRRVARPPRCPRPPAPDRRP